MGCSCTFKHHPGQCCRPWATVLAKAALQKLLQHLLSPQQIPPLLSSRSSPRWEERARVQPRAAVAAAPAPAAARPMGALTGRGCHLLALLLQVQCCTVICQLLGQALLQEQLQQQRSLSAALAVLAAQDTPPSQQLTCPCKCKCKCLAWVSTWARA